MQGYKLTEGQYRKDKITADEIWDSFNWLFSSYSRNDTSYKFIFLKSIIDCIDKKDSRGRISFDVLFDEYTRLSWNLILKYDLSQKAAASDGRRTVLENTLKQFCPDYVEYEDLFDEDRKKISHKIKMECKKYVVGALYGDTDGLFYSFSKKEEWIELNPEVEKFLNENKALIENLNYYRWASFYKNVNSVEKEEQLIDAFQKGIARKNESVYRSILAVEFEMMKEKESPRLNTLELLLNAETQVSSENFEDVDVQEELYRDCEHMKKYMHDPILLIEQLKKEKGLS